MGSFASAVSRRSSSAQNGFGVLETLIGAPRVLAWLTRQPSWTRRGGRDHFITLGRIARHFRKQRGAKSWGNEVK